MAMAGGGRGGGGASTSGCGIKRRHAAASHEVICITPLPIGPFWPETDCSFSDTRYMCRR
jgi:hypothetical protein